MNPAELLEKHGDVLYAYARARLSDDDDIQDCIQETLLAAIKNAASFAGKSSERTWLIGILKFKIIDVYRSRAREKKNQPVHAEPDYFGENRHWETERAPKAWEKSPLEHLEDAELREHLYRCIGRLPAMMRAAVVSRELDGEETPEICKRLEVTATNLNVILYRARMHLRSCLETAGFKGASVG
jgi:RNA polymerase sigma-70 factor (TIGR02943 family)